MTREPSTSFARLLLDEDEELHRDLQATRFGRALLSAAAAAPPPKEDTGPPALPATEPIMRVAIADTFTLDELDLDAQERAALLANSALVMVGRRRRLRLADDARADLLDRVHDDERYGRLLREAVREDQRDFDVVTRDEVRRPTAWLRSFLAGEFGPLELFPPEDLRAAVQARERLQQVLRLPSNVPSLAEVRRHLERVELLEPLRILIGATGGWDGAPAKDRFVGRKKELRDLRSFVDELASETWGEGIVRATKRATETLGSWIGARGKGAFLIEAGGGLGKSALMAKFVIDHALKQSQPFPFAYFDFDRAALQPREPRQLLLESARQVALQFAEVASELEALCQRIRDDLAGRPSGTSDPFVAFRALVSDRITRGRRAFLLVFDTMEVVQYDTRALSGVLRFVERLDEGGFPELLVVAVGRADIPQLRRQTNYRDAGTHRQLRPLSVSDAAEMAERLGRNLLGQDWDPAWAGLIAGAEGDPEERREPLAIRVAVELVRSAETRDAREALVRDIAKLGAAADKRFIGRLYERRVLDHVRHPEARKLAWPGLLVRRITLDIIRDVLAEPCELDPSHAEEAFTELGREVWIVERDGDALRHRPDLRARTLPLMRDHDRERFDNIVNAAIAYFGRLGATSLPDRAEWLYHRLLVGEHPESVDRDLSPDLVSFLRGAADDFDRASAAHSYLLARTEDQPLPPAQLARLPDRLAFEHVARTGASLGAFDDDRIYPVLADLALRFASVDDRSGIAATVRAIVMIKTGRWSFPDQPNDVPGSAWHTHAVFARRFKRARTFSPFTTPVPEADEEPLAIRRNDDMRAAVQTLALVRIRRDPSFGEIEAGVALTLRRPLSYPALTDLAALRTAAVLGRECARPAARLWLKTESWGGLEREPAVSLAELTVLARAGGRAQLRAETELIKPLARLGQKWDALLKLMEEQVPQPRRFVDRKLRAALLEIVAAELVDGPLEYLPTMRRFFAARDEDWIVPMGYAAARAAGPGRIPDAVVKRLLECQALSSRSSPSADDPIAVLRIADEAGDLAGVARAFLDSASDPRDASDLGMLLAHYATWRDAIEEMLTDPEEAPRPWTGSEPPEPGPILNPDDPNKGRWGGRAERDGRKVVAVLDEMKKTFFYVNLIVSATDGSPLVSPVIFHLHESLAKNVIHIRRIREGTWAMLEDLNVDRAYTVGVQVKNRDGRWIGLELDLTTLPGLPKRFR